VITRQVVALVDNKDDYEAIKPIAPYVQKLWTRRCDEEDIVPGVKPEAFAQIKWVVPLDKAEIPRNLARILAAGNEESIVDNLRRHFLPAKFEEESYSRHFRVLLHAEEYRTE
jgi:helicase MOV-10